MPAVTFLNAICTGHGCYPARPNNEASPNVFVNGIPVHRKTDSWESHECDGESHAGVLSSGSSSVFVNGLACGRIGDSVSCGSKVAQGSGNVFCG